MALRRPLNGIMLALTLTLALLLSPSVVQAADPQVTVTRVQNLPNKLFYFDDTPVSH
jgi:hypothetical protein